MKRSSSRETGKETTMTDTQKLQKLANEKFGMNEERREPEVTIVFERFVGFYAQFEQGSAFLGNSVQAEQKIKARNFNLA
jgi:hypothetical protein